MNREILFRGKRTDHNPWEKSDPWVYGDLVQRTDADGSKHYLIENNDFSEYRSYEVNEESVGQFTNRTDHNTGKKIFQDDLIFVDDSGVGGLPSEMVGGTYKVVWEEVSASFMLEQLDGMNAIPFDEVCTYMVIGNIYDNPGLIEKQDA